MTHPEFPSFFQKAETFAHSAAKAIEWLEQNPKAAKGNIATPQAALRRYRRMARKISHSAQHPPSVAVFGASQAGKSYLVTGLASPNGKTLTAHYPERNLDFLTEMNPPGGNESTALVTRFTTKAASSPNPSASVPLRLLSFGDITKILMNAYLEDFSKTKPSPTNTPVEALFQSPVTGAPVAGITGRIGPLPQSPVAGNPSQGLFNLDDIEDLHDLVLSTYAGNPHLLWTNETYWTLLKQHLPTLSLAESVRVLSPLWGQLSPLTTLAHQLFEARLSLGKSEQVFCSVAALTPREKSILHVETLHQLGQTDNLEKTDTLDLLDVITTEGKKVALHRPILAALGSEITVPLSEKPWPFLEEADLLDFPGARSRENIYDIEAFFAQPTNLGRLFLRGKIAYLFSMYQSAREINAMILCVSDSVQNVTSIPAMVDDWVNNMAGATPQARTDKTDALFVVLTKFDREFEEKKGEASTSANRWTARLHASLVDFFKASPWLKEWKPQQPFNNTFWLRSTAVAFPAVFSYETTVDGPRENGFTPHGSKLVAERHEAYLANTAVKTYIRHPERAWDEVLKANDGGISYLAEQLAQSALLATKEKQLASMLHTLSTDMTRYLHQYYRSENLAEAIQKARLEAQNVARALMSSVTAQMLPPFLRRLQITHEQLMELWQLLESNPTDYTTPIGRMNDVREIFSDMFPNAAPPHPDLQEEEKSIEPDNAQTQPFHPSDRHDQFADMVVTKWNTLIDSFAQEEGLEAIYHVPSSQVSTLTTELGTLANRLDLRQTLANSFRKQASYQNSLNLSGEIQALIAEIEIGNFITWLGYHTIPLAERPHSLGKTPQPIFLPRPPVTGLPSLQETPTPYNEQYIRDWISALVERFAENAGAVGMNGVDPAANTALKQIIDAIGNCAQ
ncbi:virulence factor SrfC family protein [Entomobacter blattae]|uniref:Bacterial virulence factor n=1 Tax=Entomobacter blattae TaxID=2762277 RepID=A0A7H1NQC8_9PROT|nr:virulence factor SrfC family protein [Entomobacter blattae]QNT77988.1 Putative bacterial virulence factor [Entomobacter blattae]